MGNGRVGPKHVHNVNWREIEGVLFIATIDKLGDFNEDDHMTL